jgi:hypothetical protein
MNSVEGCRDRIPSNSLDPTDMDRGGRLEAALRDHPDPYAFLHQTSQTSRIARVIAGRRRQLFELVFIAAIAISLAFALQAYAVKPYQIPSGSMEPTLEIGERVLVERFSTRLGGNPEIGDIVVFHPPLNAVDDEQDGPPLPE